MKSKQNIEKKKKIYNLQLRMERFETLYMVFEPLTPCYSLRCAIRQKLNSIFQFLSSIYFCLNKSKCYNKILSNIRKFYYSSKTCLIQASLGRANLDRNVKVILAVNDGGHLHKHFICALNLANVNFKKLATKKECDVFV